MKLAYNRHVYTIHYKDEDVAIFIVIDTDDLTNATDKVDEIVTNNDSFDKDKFVISRVPMHVEIPQLIQA